MSKLTHHKLVHDNYNTHIVHCFTKSRQPDDGIWSVSRINKRNIFFKNLAENEEERLVPELFLFFLKKLDMTLKQVVCSLFSINFDSPQLSIQYKQTE